MKYHRHGETIDIGDLYDEVREAAEGIAPVEPLDPVSAWDCRLHFAPSYELINAWFPFVRTVDTQTE